uniref:Transmembrane protein 126A n=1 Tax=Anguilla anguilla TaxID=7936 RepID=A0A0E9S693_ANGAN
MAVLPFLSTVALYQATISQPLLSGNLDCKACAEVRGALLGVVVGGLYPVALALPVNAGLASRYNTTPMPEKGKVLQFMVKITKPVLKENVLCSRASSHLRLLLELPAVQNLQESSGTTFFRQ